MYVIIVCIAIHMIAKMNMRSENCDSFKLDFEILSQEAKKKIKKIWGREEE